jgi:predicted alpha/beta superfamily hydrolase
MKFKITTCFCIMMAIGIMVCAGQEKAPKWPGIRDSIHSNVLKETRFIQVILPKDYQPDNKSKYEVLYVLDGEWYMEQIPFIYNFVVTAKFAPENIFVLIPNTYVNGINLRDRDFSPTKIKDDSLSGGADTFHAFLKDELIPYVEKKYPTNGQRSLVGSSFSGLFSVYAFVKDPELFQSYIASDPNLNWDNHYVTKLAAKKLASFENVESTLFFAGNEKTSRGMGSKAMDSVLTASAPRGLHWKFMEYANETHYSVQHKAFYEGMRFSHEGYNATPPEFHPMNGIVDPGKALKLFMPNENLTARFTIDGSEPTPSSPLLKSENAIIVGPAVLKVKSFPNRKAEAQEARGNYSGTYSTSTDAEMPLAAKSKKTKAGLRYSFYDGDWNSLPDFKKNKPVESGEVQKNFSLNKFKAKNNSAFLIEGNLEIPEEGYYVFASNAVDGSILYVGNRVVLETKPDNQGIKSFAIPLKKGLYPFRFQLLQKKGSPPILYYIFRTKPGNDNWWEIPFLTL